VVNGGRGWLVSGSEGTMVTPGGSGPEGIGGGLLPDGRPSRRIVSSTGGVSSGGAEPPGGAGGVSMSSRARDPLLVAGPIGIGRGVSRLRGVSLSGGGCRPRGGWLSGGGADGGLAAGGGDVAGGVGAGSGGGAGGGVGVDTGGGTGAAGGGAGAGTGGAATGHGANVVVPTNTIWPDGSCQFVPSGTNCTLRLPSGSPGGHWTFCPRWTHLHACANPLAGVRSAHAASNHQRNPDLRIDTKPPLVCEPRGVPPGSGPVVVGANRSEMLLRCRPVSSAGRRRVQAAERRKRPGCDNPCMPAAVRPRRSYRHARRAMSAVDGLATDARIHLKRTPG
jgi:hypothetical protein